MNFENIELDKKEPVDDFLGFESVEQKKVVEGFLDYAILKKYRKIDSGENGIIGLIDLKDLKNEYEFLVKNSGVKFITADDKRTNNVFDDRFGLLPEDEDKLAVKMLKIFSNDRAGQEADMQTKMSQIIKTARKQEPDKQFAGIPNVYFNRAINLGLYPELKEKLKHDDVKVDEGSVNVMAMDFLRGENMDYFLHKETLLSKGYTVEECQNKDYQWLQKSLSGQGIKGFSIALDDNSFSVDDLKRLNKNNLAALTKYLSQEQDKAIPKEIFVKIKNTLNKAHDNDIYHRDLHERNLFLHLDDNRRIVDASIIDWGEARQLTETVGLDQMEKNKLAYGDTRGQTLSDDYILRYERLSADSKDLAEQEEIKFWETVDTSLKTIKDLFESGQLGARNLKLNVAYENMVEEVDYILDDGSTKEAMIADIDREFANFSDSAMSSDELDSFRLKLALWRDFIASHQELVNDNDLVKCMEKQRPSHLRFVENEKAKALGYYKKTGL